MMADQVKAIEIFYCYALEDKGLRNQLDKHLADLRHSGKITGWYDQEIQAGKEWKREIEIHLNTANIILLLVSSDFISSDYCYSVQLQQAIKRHESEEARVIPIILRPVVWKDTPIGKLQALPRNSRAITLWRNRDAAFEDVSQDIRNVIRTLQDQLIRGEGEKKRYYDAYLNKNEVVLTFNTPTPLDTIESLNLQDLNQFLNGNGFNLMPFSYTNPQYHVQSPPLQSHFLDDQSMGDDLNNAIGKYVFRSSPTGSSTITGFFRFEVLNHTQVGRVTVNSAKASVLVEDEPNDNISPTFMLSPTIRLVNLINHNLEKLQSGILRNGVCKIRVGNGSVSLYVNSSR